MPVIAQTSALRADRSSARRTGLVRFVLEEEIEFPNDTLLVDSPNSEPNRHELIAGEFKEGFGYIHLPAIVKEMDNAGTPRLRHGDPETERTLARNAIKAALAPAWQLEFDGVE